ncbi:hypothetical protein AB0Y31_03585 [Lactobacillus crispatus]|nr:hypothetical protein [Lactobacillus crispatus]QLK31956.1 hypothetical protein H0G71_05900 [Lactobacillus crispatus]
MLIGTFSLFSIMMLLNNWSINIWTLFIFILSYVVIWITIKLTQNRQIKKRNSELIIFIHSLYA